MKFSEIPELPKGWIVWIGCLLSGGIWLSGVQAGEVLSQVSTLESLSQGDYEGSKSIAKLKEAGDFGLGTFDRLDGEMVVLDGKFYRINVEGVATEVQEEETTPFAVVCFFDAEKSWQISNVQTMEELWKQLDEQLFTRNHFYAVRISGKFRKIRTRSIPPQSEPYRELAEVLKTQATFDLEEVEGVMVGFRCPVFLDGINAPGYHFHFITKDRSTGGHVLAVDVDSAIVELDRLSKFDLRLPDTESFLKNETP